ncbi:MAG: hypothetical protein GY795_41325, partial [Desulfobacterales bacterium]|nr:hypothetical protein [Desulfobacterales bacterium]
MKQAIKTLVPEEVYTDRQEFIDYFYKYALETVPRRAMSTVLLGRRRMGKTEIFKRVVNRLFFEQDHNDPNAVVPVYYSFQDKPPDRWEFASDYTENLLRWYVAFQHRNPKILAQSEMQRNELIRLAKKTVPMPGELAGMLRIMKSLEERDLAIPEKTVLKLPREIAEIHDINIVMFLDEFQNTRLPHENFDIVGYMQEAVESPACPHFVTGSAMSILAKEILGRGSLFGRFRSKP